MPGSSTTPGRMGACDSAPVRVAFRESDDVGTRIEFLSRLNGWPACTPVNASRRTSRYAAHNSGPVWFAMPSLQGTCTLCSLPVSRRSRFKFDPGVQPTLLLF